MVLDPSLTECTLVLHFFLSRAHARSSSHDWVFGASVKMSPSLLLLYRCSTACANILVGDILRVIQKFYPKGDQIYSNTIIKQSFMSVICELVFVKMYQSKFLSYPLACARVFEYSCTGSHALSEYRPPIPLWILLVNVQPDR